MHRNIIIIIFLIASGCKKSLSKQFQRSTIRSEPVWLIPDEITAEKIARAVLEAHLGAEEIRTEAFKVVLKDDSIWVVKSLKKPFYDNGKLVDTFGGGYIFELSKRNGKIKNIEVLK
jgi:hypothetical protein